MATELRLVDVAVCTWRLLNYVVRGKHGEQIEIRDHKVTLLYMVENEVGRAVVWNYFDNHWMTVPVRFFCAYTAHLSLPRDEVQCVVNVTTFMSVRPSLSVTFAYHVGRIVKPHSSFCRSSDLVFFSRCEECLFKLQGHLRSFKEKIWDEDFYYQAHKEDVIN